MARTARNAIAAGGPLPDSWQQFYASLAAAINQQIAPIYGVPITIIQTPSQGQFLWYYENPNLIFNQGTFDYISARVSPGTLAGTAQISPSGGFPNAYVQLIGSLTYGLSSADRAAINNAVSRASAEASTVISDYQTTFGQITTAQMQTAQQACGLFAVQSLQDYVITYILGYVWSGAQQNKQPPLTYTQMAAAQNLSALLPDAPAAGARIVTDVTQYLALLKPVTALQSSVQLGNWAVAQIAANAAAPGSSNGGMQTVNPNSGAVSESFDVGYAIGLPVKSIQSSLADARSFMVTVAAPPAVGAPAAVESITVQYQGYTMVPIVPASWNAQSGYGWHDSSAIAEAYANGNADVTGFKFLTQPAYNLAAFENGGNFGELASLLISQPPSVTLNYSANTKAILLSSPADIEEMLAFAGLRIGGPGVFQSRSADGALFTLAASQPATVPLLLQAAFVIGGCIFNPATVRATSGSAVMVARRAAQARV